MTIIAYKFQSPDGSYWYIKADDQRTIDYWRDKRKLIALTDDKAVVTATGAVVERDEPPAPVAQVERVDVAELRGECLRLADAYSMACSACLTPPWAKARSDFHAAIDKLARLA